MKVKKSAEGGQFLKAKFVKENKVLEITIDDARSIKEVTFTDKEGNKTKKLQVGIAYKGKGNVDPDKWTLNNKCKNALIGAWGDDTDYWINKKIPITIGGEGEMTHILVDTMRIE